MSCESLCEFFLYFYDCLAQHFSQHKSPYKTCKYTRRDSSLWSSLVLCHSINLYVAVNVTYQPLTLDLAWMTEGHSILFFSDQRNSCFVRETKSLSNEATEELFIEEKRDYMFVGNQYLICFQELSVASRDIPKQQKRDRENYRQNYTFLGNLVPRAEFSPCFAVSLIAFDFVSITCACLCACTCCQECLMINTWNLLLFLCCHSCHALS